MDFQEIDAYLRSKKAVTVRKIEEWKFIKYLLNEKMFALVTSDEEGRLLLTVKNHKSKLNEMRIRYPGIIVPAIELEPLHWNTIYAASEKINPSVIKRAIDESYKLIYSDLLPIAKKFLDEFAEDFAYAISTKNGVDFLEMRFLNKIPENGTQKDLHEEKN